jgi:parvulin-like peptidyl-prolyl isomerase
LLLEDSPDDFDSLARNYSIEKKTAAVGGYIGDVRRGTLPENIEIRLFNASPGEIVGPYQMNGEDVYEIFQVVSINNAVLREETKEKIGRIIYNEWLENRMKEHAIDY